MGTTQITKVTLRHTGHYGDTITQITKVIWRHTDHYGDMETHWSLWWHNHPDHYGDMETHWSLWWHNRTDHQGDLETHWSLWWHTHRPRMTVVYRTHCKTNTRHNKAAPDTKIKNSWWWMLASFFTSQEHSWPHTFPSFCTVCTSWCTQLWANLETSKTIADIDASNVTKNDAFTIYTKPGRVVVLCHYTTHLNTNLYNNQVISVVPGLPFL